MSGASMNHPNLPESLSGKSLPGKSLPIVEASPSSQRFIHLLYAPTNFCNMGCSYCYLGTGTDEVGRKHSPLTTLANTVERLLGVNIVPFNLSFHGGEPTAIAAHYLRELFEYARAHYRDYGDAIKAAGLPLNPLHIKTNLYNFDKLYQLFDEFQVSISGSVDLPLFLHGKYRTDKRGRSTREKITANLRLLARYPHHKKISCVVTREHLQHLDAFIADIRLIHDDIGLDMSKFNVMFSFDSGKNAEKFAHRASTPTMLNQDEQVVFYRRVRDAFMGSELESGLREHWFKEFTPEFCCSAVNCGQKFFLLQENGDVYSCPRGQSSQLFRYGNVFEQPIEEVVDSGFKTIEAIENTLELHDDCIRCRYVPYCNVGCTFVRKESGLAKSYTCKLQKELYRDAPEKYPPYSAEQIERYTLGLRFRNNIKSLSRSEVHMSNRKYVTPELDDDKNSLSALVENDEVLREIYSAENVCVRVDGVEYALQSPTLRNRTEIALIGDNSAVELLVKPGIFTVNCTEPVNNHLMLMLLRNTMVSYGDEGRLKQEHLADYSLYQQSFEFMAVRETEARLRFDLSPLLRLHRGLFQADVKNNLFVTTKTMREYHYRKQQKNAFYHIQAINLPFPHLEFYWQHDA